jgi:hypothetical protein
VTRRLPVRMLLGSVAVLDIVLAHRVSNPDRVTSGVRTAAAVAVAAARWPAPQMIPAAIFPRPVQGRRLRFTPGIIFGPHQRDSGHDSRIRRQRCESEGAVSAGSSVWPTRMGGWLYR